MVAVRRWFGVGCMAACVSASGARPAWAQVDCLDWVLDQGFRPTAVVSDVASYDSLRSVVVVVTELGDTVERDGSVRCEPAKKEPCDAPEWRVRSTAPTDVRCTAGNALCSPFGSGCGGSGTCTLREPLWGQGGLFHNAMAYDARRGRSVLLAVNNSVMEWDGQRWTRTDPTPASWPGARIGTPLIYDSDRQVILMFGGFGGASGMFGDTWEWNGASWTQRTPLHSPPVRFEHGMAYDRRRHVAVVFGGRAAPGGTILGDLWEWDGEDWSQRQTDPLAPKPANRFAHALAYDDERGVAVLHGGSVLGAGTSNDTWDWDGQDWVLHTPRNPPINSLRHALLEDAGTHATVRIGGTGLQYARLEHARPPVIFHPPQSLEAVEGEPAEFSVQPRLFGTHTFQWMKNGRPIPGATATSHTIQAVSPADQGVYEVLLGWLEYGDFNCTTALSAPATLTVLPVKPADINRDGAVDLLDYGDLSNLFEGSIPRRDSGVKGEEE